MLRRPPRSTLFPFFSFFFFNDPATTEIYTLSLHDALPIWPVGILAAKYACCRLRNPLSAQRQRSEEHTSELQSPDHLVCRLLLEKNQKCVLRSEEHTSELQSPDHLVCRLPLLKRRRTNGYRLEYSSTISHVRSMLPASTINTSSGPSCVTRLSRRSRRFLSSFFTVTTRLIITAAAHGRGC